MILGPTGILIIVGIFVIVACLFTFDFFGATVTNGYVEGNSQYASEYISVANKNIKAGNGYVSLSRILYFYLANDKLSFDEIYTDNLDSELKQEKPISEVCLMDRYKNLYVCSSSEIANSGQIDTIQNKPLIFPLSLSSTTVTSFFMEERIIYGKSNIHSAWDLAAPAQTEVKSACSGTVTTVSFKYETNTPNTNDNAGGNYIKIQCDGEDNIMLYYAHLYPSSSKVKVGDKVIQGQVVAGVGTTGNSTGNHLHFQIIQNGNNVDGMSLVDFNNEVTQSSTSQTPYIPNVGGFTNRADCYANWNSLSIDECSILPE